MRTLVLLTLVVVIQIACTSEDASSTDVDRTTDSETETQWDPNTITDCEGGRYDSSTGFCWQHPETDEKYDWMEAKNYCFNLILAEHTDWTLPHRDDFVDILDNCPTEVLDGGNGWCNSCDDSNACNAIFGHTTAYYWSALPYNSNSTWGILMTGHIANYFSNYELNVRCVRSM